MKTKHLSLAGLLVAGALACALVLAGCDNGGGGDGGGDPGDGDPVKIDIAAIEGVTAPATGATPVTAITATAQYTGTVAWNGNPATFAAATTYTATITLTAKTGYTLQGVAANFFTVAGTSSPATNSANSGSITAVFPATAAPTVAAEYRFTITGSDYTFTLGETTAVFTGGVPFSLDGVYTEGGGTYIYGNPPVEEGTWAYLCDATGKRGIVHKVTSGGFSGTITVDLGTTAVESYIGISELTFTPALSADGVSSVLNFSASGQ